MKQTALVARLDLVILLLAKWYLLIDSLQGLLQTNFGKSFALSASYKSILLLLIGISLITQQKKYLWLWPLCLVLWLAGPFYSLLLYGNGAGFQYDLGMSLKLLSPALALAYFYCLGQRNPQLAQRSLHQIIWLSFIILTLNLLAGRLGYGYSAYLPNDHLPDTNLGTKGFFKATNELSALLLVLAAYLLAWYWPKQKWLFGAIVLVSIANASAMLTKTGLAGVLLLALLIPLLQSLPLWRPYAKWIGIVAAVKLLLLLLCLWQLPWIISMLPLSESTQLRFAQQGLLSILLSTRDVYLSDNWQLSARYFSDWHRLFGIGFGGLAVFSQKPLAEIDPGDLLLWFGLPGLLWFGLWFATQIKLSGQCWWQQPASLSAGILSLNLLLLMVSAMAGHVLTSGMLWIPWGMLNGALWLYAKSPITEEPDVAR